MSNRPGRRGSYDDDDDSFQPSIPRGSSERMERSSGHSRYSQPSSPTASADNRNNRYSRNAGQPRSREASSSYAESTQLQQPEFAARLRPETQRASVQWSSGDGHADKLRTTPASEPGAVAISGPQRGSSLKSADDGIPSLQAPRARGSPRGTSHAAAKARRTSPATMPGAYAQEPPSDDEDAEVPKFGAAQAGAEVAGGAAVGAVSYQSHPTKTERPQLVEHVAGPNLPAEPRLVSTASNEYAATPPPQFGSTVVPHEEVAVAAQLVPDEDDIEKQVQSRVHNEREEIAAQVQKRLMDQAVHADVMEEADDGNSQQKKSLFRRRVLILGGIACLVIVAVVVAVAVVVSGNKSDRNNDAVVSNPRDVITSVPTSLPTTLPPTPAPTPEPQCTLCADGTVPFDTDTKEYPLGGDGVTCADFMAEQALRGSSDTECVQGQALAWLYCGCPNTPPFPDGATCTICDDASIPTDKANTKLGFCVNGHSFLAHVGSSPLFQCGDLRDTFLQHCSCGDEDPRVEYMTNFFLPISGNVIMKEGTPQNQALNWLLNDDPAQLTQDTATEQELTQRYIVMTLFFSTGGIGWTKKFNFQTELDVCSWNDGNDNGVFCDGSQNVEKIELDFNNLTGQLPNEITFLSFLKMLELTSNAISGTIPENIGNLSSMTRFDIGKNSVSGTIPASLFNLPALEEVEVDVNPLTGQLPELTGSLSTLQKLNAFDCSLNGTIPASISLLPNLIFLSIGKNSLTGTSPTFSGTPKIETIELNENQLTGTLPETLASLTRLDWLSFFTNQLRGPIPAGISTLSSLSKVFLSENFLTGTLPAFTGGNINEVWVRDNRLTGTLDDFFDSTTKSSLLKVRFEENQFEGTIPLSIGDFSRLNEVNLRDNLMSGPLPPELGSLRNLQVLTLFDGGFSGTIPTELGQTNLVTLDLSLNNLEGTVPTELSNFARLEQLGLARCGLTGIFPDAIANLPNLIFLVLQGNDFTNNYAQTLCTRPNEIDNLVTSCQLDSIDCPCCSLCCDEEGFNCVNNP